MSNTTVKDRREEIKAEVAAKIEGLKWIKIIGVGNIASGKTCLIKYFCENKFAPGYQPTVGVDYGFKIEQVNEEEIRVHLWDLSGNDEYYDTRIELYQQTDGVIIVYDVTSQSSFDGVARWLDEINKMCHSSPVVMLCGCKIDQFQKRVVPRERAEEWARQQKIGYYEVSSASGENVTQMYDTLLAKVLNKKK